MKKTPKNTCPPLAELERYAVGDLRDDDTTRVSTHLDECIPCGETVDSFHDSSDTFFDAFRNLDPQIEFLEEPELIQGIDRLRSSMPRASASETPGPDVSKQLADFPDRSTMASSVRGGRETVETPLDRSRQLGPYQIVAKLGQGGMGAVYKAIHTHLGKTVAIKVLSSTRVDDRQAIERFKREMKAIGRVQHPNVVIAYDGGQIGNEYFIVMEYVEGVDISKLVRRHGKLPSAVACEIIRQAAIGLQHAHEMGLIHRDIKPSNLILDRAGVVKVLDLGLARIESDLSSASVKKQTGQELTATGNAMGTFGYMSPEQALDSSRIDQRADLYSLGATLYKLLAGTLPFPTEKFDTTGKMLVAIATHEPPSLRTARPELPIELIRLVDQMLAKEAGDRVETAAEFSIRLTPFAGLDLAGLADCTAGQLPSSLVGESPKSTVDDNAVATLTKSGFTKIGKATLALVTLLFVFSTLAQVFWLRTEYGTLIVEIDDEQVEARLKSDGIAVIDKRSHRVWQINTGTKKPEPLPEGEYRFDAPDELMITDDQGLEITAKEFKLLDANKQLRIRVSMASTETQEATKSSDPYEREIAAAKWVESVGGIIHEGNPFGRAMTPGEVAKKPGSLNFIELSGLGEINDIGKNLANLPNLQVLFATDTSLNSDDLAQIVTNRNIYWVHFRGTRLKSQDFRLLSALPRLNSLGLDWSQVDDNWEFMKDIPWLPEVQLDASEPPQLDELCKHQQLDTIWLGFDYAKSQTTESELVPIAEKALRQNSRLRIGINGKIVGTDPVRELAKKLSDEGWRLSGVHSNWKDPWDSKNEDAWSGDDWFHVRSIEAPDNLRLTAELLESLPALGHAFDSLRFSGATNSERLPGYLRSRVVNRLVLNDSDLNDATLRRIAEMSGVNELEIVHTSVSTAGVEAFRRLWPNCKLTHTALAFDPSLPNSSIIEAHESLLVASDASDEYELAFSLKRESGNEGALLVQIPVRDTRVTVVLAGYAKTRSGLSLIDGKQAHVNESSVVGDPFTDGNVHRVTIRVTKPLISVAVDGATLLEWKGDLSRLSSFESFSEPGVHIISGEDTRFQISDWSLQNFAEYQWPSDQPDPGLVPLSPEQATELQDEWANHLGVEVEITNSISMKFRVIPPGEFLMGTSQDEMDQFQARVSGQDGDLRWFKQQLLREIPQHHVVLTKPFQIGVHEVTRGQYRAFVEATGYKTDAEKDGMGGFSTAKNPNGVQSIDYLWSADECDRQPARLLRSIAESG
ncbi:bifunctional serine/threonine-protein kinase/formylglycine-generating enzyme family protein [Stieleria varia]|uniref:Serine/threonine-protein kinase PrkC n=1 Tax=Stieleria varia TaxID=2528005 RepID=A0A5C5ZX85_9BACT|nr:bifunctional serine/threonine-protein kinase/formylglycine-generating enzyme family protein [Stieleria varia]TWT91588.1 Serine/threonine-protein kinase PrkC [Stieleria varia]